jgi:hypothetical protein
MKKKLKKREGWTKPKEDPKVKQRRYYLHRRVKLSYKIDAPNKTVFVPATRPPEGKNELYLNELKSYGYGIQLAFQE